MMLQALVSRNAKHDQSISSQGEFEEGVAGRELEEPNEEKYFKINKHQSPPRVITDILNGEADDYEEEVEQV